jgi:predicted AlkP superfamily phosphohydrolase/phosphomutase
MKPGESKGEVQIEEIHEAYFMTENTAACSRVLVVGWDGATFDLIGPWVEQGHMPNTAKLLQNGGWRRLQSVIPTLSPPAWTSFISGKNPGRHGTFDFFRRNTANYELMTVRNDLPRIGTLFNRVSRAGKSVGIINVPFTYPPEPVNGFMISGLGAAPEWEFVYPKSMRTEVLERGYRIDNPIAYNGKNDDEYLAAAMNNTRVRSETALHFLRREPWDLAMVVFMNIDQILSFMWHHTDESHPRYDPNISPRYQDAALEMHRYLDDVLGKMMAEAGDDALVVVASDHGMGPLYKEVFLNNWLEDRGYLVRKKRPAVARGYNTFARRIGLSRERIWRRIGRARTQAAKKRLPKRLHGLVPTEHKSLTEVVDWSQTVAYSFGNVGQIFVNMKGREPEGIVEPGEAYERVVNSLIDNLKTFVDPEDGRPVVDQIFRREDLYDGPFFDRAPDLNVIMRDYGYIAQMRREFAAEQVILHPALNMSGFHRRDGVFMAHGPLIRQVGLPDASIIQVTPTILYALGLSIPDDMDGQPMLDLFDEDYVAENPARATEADQDQQTGLEWTPEQEAEVRRRLEDLGYLS